MKPTLPKDQQGEHEENVSVIGLDWSFKSTENEAYLKMYGVMG